MGWLTLFLLAGAAMAGLVALGVPRTVWAFAGAALMLGAAGYALQGSPAQPASPARAGSTPVAAEDAGLVRLRDQMLGRWTAQGAYLVASDGMTRAGEPRAAVQWVLAGINRYPDNTALWVGLGTTLAASDGNRVSPPALFAFRRAGTLSPDHPGPPFFLGLAYIRAGEFAAARPYWARALALTPPQVSYRREIAQRLALLDTYLAEAR